MQPAQFDSILGGLICGGLACLIFVGLIVEGIIRAHKEAKDYEAKEEFVRKLRANGGKISAPHALASCGPRVAAPGCECRTIAATGED